MDKRLEWMRGHADEINEIRELFHREPELSRHEFKTNERIRAYLDKWGVEYLAPESNITIALLKGAKDGPVTAFRCDTDALSVTELTGADFASRVPGVMHACGHDTHITMGLAAARYLSLHPETFSGTVKVIFQPAEEGEGGARAVIATGLVNDVSRFFGLHVWPHLPVGAMGLIAGAVCSGTDKMTIRVKGVGGHGACPDKCRDAVVAAAAVVSNLQTIVARNVPPMKTAVLSIGTIHAGTRWNVIADEAVMTGTMRTLDLEAREIMTRRMEEVVEYTCRAQGCTGEVTVENLHGIVINDETVTRFARDAAVLVLGGGAVDAEPAMIGDDFSMYSAIAPACYAFLGCTKPGDKNIYPLHHGCFLPDKEALLYGAAWLCACAGAEEGK